MDLERARASLRAAALCLREDCANSAASRAYSDAEVDRIEDALAARASDIFMATGLLIPCALFDAPEPA